jgi:hypothetical protein
MLLWAASLALLFAALSAGVLARRRADHRPFAALLVWVALTDILRAALAASFGLVRPPGLPPFTGASRVAFHVDEAIGLSGPTVLAIVAILLFSRRRWFALLPGLVWVGSVAYLATHYPEIRGEPLRRVYLAAELSGLVLAGASIIPWVWRKDAPTPARMCMIALCLVNGGLLFVGSLRFGFWHRQDLEQASLTLLYLTITAFQVYLWRSTSRSQSPPS